MGNHQFGSSCAHKDSEIHKVALKQKLLNDRQRKENEERQRLRQEQERKKEQKIYEETHMERYAEMAEKIYKECMDNAEHGRFSTQLELSYANIPRYVTYDVFSVWVDDSIVCNSNDRCKPLINMLCAKGIDAKVGYWSGKLELRW